MRHALMISAALSLLTVGVGPAANAQKIDANGRCHDNKTGNYAKPEVCKGAAPAAAVDPGAPYKLDGKGNCHDVKGKMSAKKKCAA